MNYKYDHSMENDKYQQMLNNFMPTKNDDFTINRTILHLGSYKVL